MPTKIQKIRCKSKKKSVKYNRPQRLLAWGQKSKVVIAQRFACKELSIINCQLSIVNCQLNNTFNFLQGRLHLNNKN